MISFLVLPNKIPFNFDTLLGIEFIRKNKLEICIKEWKLVEHFDNSAIEIYLDKNGQSQSNVARNIRCYAAENICIPQGQLVPTSVSFEVDGIHHDEMLFYSDSQMSDSLSTRLQSITGICERKRNQYS